QVVQDIGRAAAHFEHSVAGPSADEARGDERPRAVGAESELRQIVRTRTGEQGANEGRSPRHGITPDGEPYAGRVSPSRGVTGGGRTAPASVICCRPAAEGDEGRRRRRRMPKPELEFFRPDHLPWQPVEGSRTGGAGGPGVEQKILSRDAATGAATRLLRFAAGV